MIKKNKIKKKKKKFEFSKMLAVINTIVYLLMLIFCVVMWIAYRDFPNSIFTTVTTQYATTLSVYMVKAGVENYAKINNYDYADFNEKNGGF